MGGGASKSEDKSKTLKLLLLGSANVGKSTVFRQMKVLYDDGFTDEERLIAKYHVFENLMEALLELEAASLSRGDSVQLENEEIVDEINPVLLELRTTNTGDFEDIVENPPELTTEFISKLRRLWDDPAIQKIYKERLEITNPSRNIYPVTSTRTVLEAISNSHPLSASTKHILANFDRICQPDFLPSNEDMILLRVITRSSHTVNFKMEVKMMNTVPQTLYMSCTDVGGQAHERLEWKKHSENLNAVIFVASLAAFNTVDQNNENELQSQFKLLETICLSPYFADAIIIVCLNKSDLLKEKLVTEQLSTYFEDFDGENNVKGAFKYFKSKVIEIANRDHGDVKSLLTCATDSQLMEKIIYNIGESVFMRNVNNMFS